MNTRDAFWKNNCKQHTTPFIPRIAKLQALNGTQFKLGEVVDTNKLDAIKDDARDLVRLLFKLNNLNLSECILAGKVGEKNLSKWLIHSHIPENIVSQICAAKIPGRTLTLTTRYKDFARMGRSTHFSTCATTNHLRTTDYYLHKPNTFMLVDRDPAGEFRTRVIGRLTRIITQNDAEQLGLPLTTEVILFNRVYGVLTNLPEEINGIPCFAQEPKGETTYSDSVRISYAMVHSEIDPERLHAIAANGMAVYDDLHVIPRVIVSSDRIAKYKKRRREEEAREAQWRMCLDLAIVAGLTLTSTTRVHETLLNNLISGPISMWEDARLNTIVIPEPT